MYMARHDKLLGKVGDKVEDEVEVAKWLNLRSGLTRHSRLPSGAGAAI